jgi:ribulose 1,5-bisphosphate synthetase/thiazole synthase
MRRVKGAAVDSSLGMAYRQGGELTRRFLSRQVPGVIAAGMAARERHGRARRGTVAFELLETAARVGLVGRN